MPQYTILSLSMGEDFDGNRDELPADVKEAYLDAAFGTDVSGAVSHGLYKPTSVVQAPNPEELFARTQHIDKSWDEVNPPSWSDGPLRSTSVGDAIINHDTNEVFSCATMGWSGLEGDDAASLRSLRVEAAQPAPGV